MRLLLKQMNLENFKGIRNLTILLGGNETRISGMNGSGKSTIADAFSWVLFNKNSRGDAPGSDNFREKPLDENGKEIHNLDTMVELICELDGKPFNLRRKQSENWQKSRGQLEAVYKGNVSTYWINDVETKQSDFKAEIAKIASEDVFRLIGSLSEFNRMEWKKRREQLLAIAGNDVDSELLASDEYRQLADEVGQRGIGVDELRKVLSDQRKRMNEHLKMMPVRIDEAKKALPEFGATEIKDAEYIIADSEKDLEKINALIAEAKSVSGETGSRTRVLALEQELVSLKRRIMDDYMAMKRNLRADSDRAAEDFRRISAVFADAKTRYTDSERRLSEAKIALEGMRKKFLEVRDAEPQSVETVCPYCGQDMPEAAVAKARESAEQKKKDDLAKINDLGKAAKENVKQLETALEASAAEIKSVGASVESAAQERDKAFEAAKNAPIEPDYTSEPRIAEVEAEIAEAKAALNADPNEQARQYEDRKREIQKIIDSARAVLAKRDAGLETEKRITQLEAEQKELGVQIAETEKLIWLAEKFVQDRCGALEASINSHFPNVRWKLFEQQINGGITDVCTCLIPCDGATVCYECANTASQVNADLEIVNVLSDHYDLRLPLFVDNAERVNRLGDTDSQLITLAVSTSPELTIEQY